MLELSLLVVVAMAGEAELDRATALDFEAEQLDDEGDYAGALPLAKESLRLRETHDAPPRLVARSCANLAEILLATGEPAAALPYAERATEIHKKRGDPDALGHALNKLARIQKDLSDYESALATTREGLAIRRAGLGDPHLDVAQSLHGLGDIFADMGRFVEAIANLEQAIQMRRALDAEPTLIAKSINNLAIIRYTLGEYDGAIEDFEQVYEVFLAEVGPTHPFTAVALGNLAAVLEEVGQLDRALALSKKQLATAMEVLGPDHPDVADAHNGLAVMYFSKGDYDGALEHVGRANEIYEAAGRDQDQILTLGNMGQVLDSLGRYEEGERAVSQAVDIAERLWGRNHLEFASALSAWAGTLANLGRSDEAVERYREVLTIREAILGREHKEVAASINNLAFMAQDRGDYVEARGLFEEALALFEEVVGHEHEAVAMAMGNLALVLDEIGDGKKAGLLYEESVALRERLLGPDHPDLGKALANLAQSKRTRGDLDGALVEAKRSLAIFREAFGDHHPLVIHGLNNIGLVLFDQGDVDGAQAAHKEALAGLSGVEANLELEATTMLNIVAVLERKEAYEEALALYEAALPILIEGVSEHHPLVAYARMRGAIVRDAMGDVDGARAECDVAFQSSSVHVMGWLDTLSEREALAAIGEHRQILDGWLNLHDRPADAERNYDAILSWKGAVSRRMAARRQVSSPELTKARADIARHVYSQVSSTPEERKATLADLTERKEKLERDLAEQSASFREELARSRADSKAVAAALPAEVALVDYLRITAEPDDVYVAFVLTSDGAVTRLKLGGATLIEDALLAWREALAYRDPNGAPMATWRIDERGAVVHDLVWAPVSEHLGETGHVIVVPDAATATVPFAALPTAKGRYLVEDRAITYLESATDLLGDDDGTTGSGALVVGDVAFGEATASSDALAMRAAACAEGPWNALDGTGAEIRSVAARWRRTRGKEPLIQLAGDRATEAAVAENLGGNRLLHIATHGFFADPARCSSALAREGGNWHPLLLSGVVLSGANQPSQQRGEGILTAEEVAGVDLRGTELVVLSACETGLGQIQSGEGVLGLRRAFLGSGARTIIMSLWSVGDRATSALMSDLYAAVLARRHALPPSEALRAAQLQMLERSRDEFREGRPQDWAAWVSSGDWDTPFDAR